MQGTSFVQIIQLIPKHKVHTISSSNKVD